ncbi:MAG: hypothetical protein LAN62_06350 [Acidobacteriia bacterium]|nr:hypothetical protein [Terriglobia bacterium]
MTSDEEESRLRDLGCVEFLGGGTYRVSGAGFWESGGTERDGLSRSNYR